MNIFHKITLQGMKKSRTRTIVTIIGVILSAAMITAVATFSISLLHYMTNGAIAKYGDWHMAFRDVDASFVQAQASNKEVAHIVTCENLGYAELEGAKDSNKPYLFVTAYRDDTFASLPITLLSGRMPQNSTEVLVSGKVAIEAGVKFSLSDTLSLTLGNRMSGSKKLGQSDPYNAQNEIFVAQGGKTYTVVGICQRPSFEENSAPGYTLITKMDAEGSADSFSLFITLKDPIKYMLI